MNDDSWSRLSSENSTKMESFNSTQGQCCCCVVAVLVSFGGVIMTSIGVCFILNYGMLTIDIGIFPPELQTEEGKKIIGIILICFGITGIIISSVVSILFFTICHSSQSPQTISPMYYDNRAKDSPLYIVDRSVTPGVKAARPLNRVAMPLASTPRKDNNIKKKKMPPTILEIVKEDPVPQNPLPILQINGIKCNGGALLPMKDINQDSLHSQNSTPIWGKDNLQTGATPSLDIATIQVTNLQNKDSEINSSKL